MRKLPYLAMNTYVFFIDQTWKVDETKVAIGFGFKVWYGFLWYVERDKFVLTVICIILLFWKFKSKINHNVFSFFWA